MAKMTVLDMVQDILRSMNSDEVNSISDTEEAEAVAYIVKNTYFDLIDNKHWPHLEELATLTATSSTTPTHMILPELVQEVLWIKYNKRLSTDTRDKYVDIDYLDPKDFMDLVMSRNSSASNVETVTDISGVSLLIVNDTPPTYWTSFDDEYVVFDSYDSTVETNLQASKVQCRIYKEATFSLSDTHTPDLPSKIFSLFLSEAKSTAFNEIKQAPNGKEEQKSRRARTWQSRQNWRTAGGIKYPNYGRR